jgi:hypothetical protein
MRLSVNPVTVVGQDRRRECELVARGAAVTTSAGSINSEAERSLR